MCNVYNLVNKWSNIPVVQNIFIVYMYIGSLMQTKNHYFRLYTQREAIPTHNKK